jgi:hypothetical protein
LQAGGATTSPSKLKSLTRNSAAGSHAGGEASFEVVRQFAFQNNMFLDIETNPSAYAEHIQIVI